MHHGDLVSGLDRLMIPHNEEVVSAIETYHKFLESRNDSFNLTTVTDWQSALSRHYLDSASLILAGKFADMCDVEGTNLIDIGTGPGLPGIILKLLFPKLKVTLLEASAKKSGFLEEICGELSLEDVDIVRERAEIQGHVDGYRESFDLVVSRAVARLNVLVEYSLPFCKVGGSMIAMKGKNVDKEFPDSQLAVEELGGVITEVVDCSITLESIEGRLVVITKERPTSHNYPRRAGIPAKRPIS